VDFFRLAPRNYKNKQLFHSIKQFAAQIKTKNGSQNSKFQKQINFPTKKRALHTFKIPQFCLTLKSSSKNEGKVKKET